MLHLLQNVWCHTLTTNYNTIYYILITSEWVIFSKWVWSSQRTMPWSDHRLGCGSWQIMKTTTRFALSPAGLISQHWHHITNNHMAVGNSDQRRKSVQCVIIMLTMSLYSFSFVNQRARAHLRPLVTALTPWGLIGPEEKPANRPQVGFTWACREKSKIQSKYTWKKSWNELKSKFHKITYGYCFGIPVSEE